MAGITTKPDPDVDRGGTTGRQSFGVRVSGLRRQYGSHVVLDDIQFSVPARAVCTLLGASGSGKTTTLRLVAGLDFPDGGSIWIGDRQVAGGGIRVPADKREVGLVFQSYALWPHLRVFDQIAYPLRARRFDRASIRPAVEEVAETVGLRDLLHRYPSELSGGQQQRVAVARAIVFRPRVLLLDEPLSNLDAQLRRQTRLELQSLQQRMGITTIYVTHDQEEAMAVSDVVVLMSEGRIVHTGTPREVYERPTSLFGAAFVGASNLIAGKVISAAGGRAEVALDSGARITGQAMGELALGDQVHVTIKPADVVLDPADQELNRLPGVVVSAVFVGSHLELVVQVDRAQFHLTADRDASLSPLDRVQISLPPDRVCVLRST